MTSTPKKPAAKGKMRSFANLPLPNQEKIDDLKPLTAAERAAMEPLSSDSSASLSSGPCSEDSCSESEYEDTAVTLNASNPWRRTTETLNPQARTYFRPTGPPTAPRVAAPYIPTYPNKNDVVPEDFRPFPEKGYGSRASNQMLYTFAPASSTEFTDADVKLNFTPPTAIESALSRRFNELSRTAKDLQTSDGEKWGGGRTSNGMGVLEFFSYAGEGLGNAIDGKAKGLVKFDAKNKEGRLTTVGDRGRKKRAYKWKDEGWKKGGAKRRRVAWEDEDGEVGVKEDEDDGEDDE